MGNCITRLKAEMASPPPISGNWKDFGPRKAIPRSPQNVQARRRCRKESGNDKHEKESSPLIARRETSSGIEGLTFDNAGRPVWRDPKLQMHDSDDSDVARAEDTAEII